MSSPIAEAKIKLAYPIYAADFDPCESSFLLVGGGGGEGRSGIPNKIVGTSTLEISILTVSCLRHYSMRPKRMSSLSLLTLTCRATRIQ